jgi:hypothetical protein
MLLKIDMSPTGDYTLWLLALGFRLSAEGSGKIVKCAVEGFARA